MNNHPIFNNLSVWGRTFRWSSLSLCMQVRFHREMLWPEATISHSKKVTAQLLENNN